MPRNQYFTVPQPPQTDKAYELKSFTDCSTQAAPSFIELAYHTPNSVLSEPTAIVNQNLVLSAPIEVDDTNPVLSEPTIFDAQTSVLPAPIVVEERNSVLSESTLIDTQNPVLSALIELDDSNSVLSDPTTEDSGVSIIATAFEAADCQITSDNNIQDPPILNPTPASNSQHLDIQPSPPSQNIHPLSLELFHSEGEALYKVRVGNTTKLMTIKEQRETLPPGKPLKSYTISVEKHKALRLKIRRRISKSFREKELVSKVRCLCKKANKPLPPIPKASTSSTMKELFAFFKDEYVKYHDAGLPVRMEIDDPLEPSPAYYAKVIAAYKNKPPNYESMLTKVINKN